MLNKMMKVVGSLKTKVSQIETSMSTRYAHYSGVCTTSTSWTPSAISEQSSADCAYLSSICSAPSLDLQLSFDHHDWASETSKSIGEVDVDIMDGLTSLEIANGKALQTHLGTCLVIHYYQYDGTDDAAACVPVNARHGETVKKSTAVLLDEEMEQSMSRGFLQYSMSELDGYLLGDDDEEVDDISIFGHDEVVLQLEGMEGPQPDAHVQQLYDGHLQQQQGSTSSEQLPCSSVHNTNEHLGVQSLMATIDGRLKELAAEAASDKGDGSMTFTFPGNQHRGTSGTLHVNGYAPSDSAWSVTSSDISDQKQPIAPRDDEYLVMARSIVQDFEVSNEVTVEDRWNAWKSKYDFEEQQRLQYLAPLYGERAPDVVDRANDAYLLQSVMKMDRDLHQMATVIQGRRYHPWWQSTKGLHELDQEDVSAFKTRLENTAATQDIVVQTSREEAIAAGALKSYCGRYLRWPEDVYSRPDNDYDW